jgi:phage terminase large subunit
MIYTTAIDKIRKLKTRKKIIQGGSSSGKTYAILTILIDICIKNPRTSISVVSESMPHLRRGAVRDFLNIMKSTNRYIPDNYNKSSLTYTFNNDSYVEFFSADKPDKLKGARRDILYINECNHVSQESYIQLSTRTRGDIYLDYNPDRTFWAITDVLLEPDADRIILKYHDNEALEESVINQFKINQEKAKTSEYWKNWCRVYIDGEIGSLEGVVFDNWRTIDYFNPKDDDWIDEVHLISVGLDFGYTNDPTAAVAIWKWNDKYILDQILYEKNLTNSAIYKGISAALSDIYGLSPNEISNIEIWADSAEPKSIKELKNWGFRKIDGVVKGKDSINWGISVIQEYELLVTHRSVELIEELQNYTWVKDKWTGMKLNKPIDDYNHLIDAMRYVFMSKMGKKKDTSKIPFRVVRR